MSESTPSTVSDISLAAPTNSSGDLTFGSEPPREPVKPAYIPPHLRHVASLPAAQASPYTLPQQYFPASAIFAHYGVVHGGTINPSINNHRLLAYVLIFLNQHPQYPDKIFVKSHLDLIFKRENGEELNPLLEGLLVPLFEEEKRGGGGNGGGGGGGGGARAFRFRGWARVAGAQRLVKGSEALIDMLIMKWRRDTPRRSGWKVQMLERERERERIAAGEATVTTTVEKSANGEKLVVENCVFKDDPDDEVEEEGKKAEKETKVEGTIAQKLEKTAPRSEMAWKNSLSVDWAVVTLELVDCDKGNPMHGPPVQLTAPAFVNFDDDNYNKKDDEKPQAEEKIVREKKPEKPIDEDIEELLASTDSISLAAAVEKKDADPVHRFGTDGADDAVLVNDDLDSASIPSSPLLEPSTPKKGSAVNLPAYALAKSWDDGALRLPEKNGQGLAVSSEDISASYMSAGASSVADDFAAMSATDTEAEESDRWSELSEHEREDEHWMAVERGGMAREVF